MIHTAIVDWNGRWHTYRCSCGRSQGGFLTEHRAKMAMRRHIAWYSRQSKDDEPKPIPHPTARVVPPEPESEPEPEPDEDEAEPYVLIMPVVREAQPVNPLRRLSFDIEDTNEL